MTRLTLTRLTKEHHAVFGPPFRMRDVDPVRALDRVERAMTWLLGQPSPHEVVMDDPSGVAVALVTAWCLTNDFACSVTLMQPDGKKMLIVGILGNGHAFCTALDPGAMP